jgi:predicted amidohydrolase
MWIAVAQMDCVAGDVSANADTAAGLVMAAAERGAEVVVLPELADVGYDMSLVPACAEEWSSSRYLARLMEEAARAGVVVISGLTGRVGDRIFNSVAVTDGPGSLLGAYRKVHLWGPGGEPSVFTPGDAVGQLPLGGLQVGLTVCFDLRFPMLYHPLAVAGTELFVVASAWPFPRLRHWSTLLAARAIENQCYMAAANRVGTDGSVTFCGSSAIIDPYGTVVASADEVSSGVVVGEALAERVTEVRQAIPVLGD